MNKYHQQVNDRLKKQTRYSEEFAQSKIYPEAGHDFCQFSDCSLVWSLPLTGSAYHTVKNKSAHMYCALQPGQSSIWGWQPYTLAITARGLNICVQHPNSHTSRLLGNQSLRIARPFTQLLVRSLREYVYWSLQIMYASIITIAVGISHSFKDVNASSVLPWK